MAIIWNNELEVGIAEIDDRHQELYTLVNGLHDAMRRGDRRALPRFADRLHTLAEAQFSIEERHMSALQFPELAAHREEHQRFVADVAAFREALHGDTFRPSVVVDLSLFVTNWIRAHVRGADRGFGRWIAARELAAARGAAARGMEFRAA